MGYKKRIIGGFLIATLILGNICNVNATDIKEAKDKEQKIEQERQQAETEKDQLLVRLKEISNSLKSTQTQLEEKQKELDRAEQELVLAKMEENSQYQSMKMRIKYMYERGDVNVLEILLQSESVSDFLNKAEYVSGMTTYDRKKLDEYQITVRNVKDKEEELQYEYERITALQDELSIQRAEAEQLLEEKSAQLETISEELIEIKEQIKKAQEEERKRKEAEEARRRQEEAKRRQEEERRKQEEERRQEEEEKRKQEEEKRKQEEEKRKQEEEEKRKQEEEEKRKQEEEEKRQEEEKEQEEEKPPVVSGNGYFTHPCPGMSYQSSYFGEVRHGIGDPTPHKGHDYAAARGTPIYAAAAGRVLIAGYSYSAGYWVVIDHGNGLVSKYMHMYQAPYVSAGEYVAKGQHIGGVGTTGQSTGNHLHFQVEEYGVAVNPSKYM